MFAKIKAMLGSVRFWMVVIFGVITALENNGYITNGTGKTITELLQIITGGGVVVRTVDKFRSNG